MATLCGRVENIIFRNDQNGYTVLELGSDDRLDTVCGTFAAVNVGDSLSLDGEWRTHKDYGEQFIARSYQLKHPETLEDIEAYLASGCIAGIGPSTARAIVDTFGEDALDIMLLSPQRLTEVPKIGKVKAEMIAQSYAEQANASATMMFLQKIGITPGLAGKIYKAYGASAKDRITANPYCLIDDIEGVGFRTADTIAAGIGIAHEDLFRLCGGICACLQNAAGDGHMFLPYDELVVSASRMLEVSAESIKNVLDSSINNKRITVKQLPDCTAVYLTSYYHTEQKAAARLAQLYCVKATPLAQNNELARFEQDMDITLAPLQRQAVCNALNNSVMVITGGPGTGKTTIIKCILALMHARGLRVELAAPTGRAAKRMSEATGEDARTIHRLLEYTPMDGGFHFAKDASSPLDTDVCIVDEASMIDIFLFNALLDALKPGTRLIIVGDADQLPSVGAGNVLHDIIDCGSIPVCRLTEIFRQEGGSMIVVNAHRINNGQYPELNGKGTDFFFEAHTCEADTANAVAKLVTQRLPNHFKADALKDIQVLCPQKKGECGVLRLNSLLQQALNPPQRYKKEIQRNDYLWREGDKVMQIRNNYTIEWKRITNGVLEEGTGAFNGDLGYIISIDDGVTVRFEDGREAVYEMNMLDDLMPAYAISVHKSQGCEFGIVVLPLFSGPPMLYVRNLLYTAVTRAKRAVVVVGRKETLFYMVNNNIISNRYSNLSNMIKENIHLYEGIK